MRSQPEPPGEEQDLGGLCGADTVHAVLTALEDAACIVEDPLALCGRARCGILGMDRAATHHVYAFVRATVALWLVDERERIDQSAQRNQLIAGHLESQR